MGPDPIAQVRTFLVKNAPSQQIWIAPKAADLLAEGLGEAMPPAVAPVEVPSPDPLHGPAVLLATASDLKGPHRADLLALAEEALPGRPVICGGAANKDLLLDAMNNWRVFHILPGHPSKGELRDALERAHRACALEHAVTLCALQLQECCKAQQDVLAELEATREQLLHAERRTTVGGFCRSLSARLRQHLERLRALERSLQTLPDDPRRAELLTFTVQNVHAVDDLLDRLLEKAEASSSETCDPPASTSERP